VSNSTQYSLYVGNSYRAYDIYSNYVSGGTTTVSGIPTDGRTIYVSLWSFINGVWVPADYTYKAETPTTQGSTITVSASPSAGGTVSGGGTFAAGSSVTVTATASAGYTFSTWTENGNAVVAQNNYTFTVSGSRNLVANFIPNSQARAQMTSPAAGSTFSSGTVTFNWSQVSNSTQYSLYVGNSYRGYDIYSNYVSGGSTVVSGIPTDGRTIYVSLWSFINGIWVPADYTYHSGTSTTQGFAITASASPSAGGTVSGGGTFGAGTSVTLTATANAGYTFSTWTENGNAIVAQNNYTFTVSGSRNLVAYFISNSQPRAQLTNLANGATFNSSTMTFTWTPVSNATQYSLYVGNSYRGYDIYSNYVSGGTTAVSGIPTDGRTIYVSLWSFINGIWVPADYSFHACSGCK
ncbi:MAG TPA: hypothetical protein VFC63_05595, partial [Blastocatellia bacterium]|nr:hypothetical protein [Blastocatellia bacterium]